MIRTIVVLVSLLSSHALAQQAQPLFKRHCASCHGVDGKGSAEQAKMLKVDPKLLDLTRPEAAALSPEERRNIVLKGKDKMPAYEQKKKPTKAMLVNCVGVASK